MQWKNTKYNETEKHKQINEKNVKQMNRNELSNGDIEFNPDGSLLP